MKAKKTYERYIPHAVHDNPLVFRCVLRYAPEVRFYDMIPIEEWHLAIWLHPYLKHRIGLNIYEIHRRVRQELDRTHLVFRILGQIIQRGDMKLELPTLTEFAKTRPKTNKIGSRHTNGKTHRRFGDIINAIAVQSKAIGFVLPVYKMHNIFTLWKQESGTSGIVCRCSQESQ
jgi:hypothetical protein